MFKSRKRPIAIPQLEHARLSGYLAQVWGNEAVDAPPIDPAAFTLGVTHHDRGYGHLDTMGIGEVDESIWLATQQRGIVRSLVDSVADTVALMHIRRLVASGERENVAHVIAAADGRIAHNIAQTPYSRQDFERADYITDLCDMVSFYFCFGITKQFDRPVYAQEQDDMQTIQVTIPESGPITLDPWPLSVPMLQGFIIGYELAGYPDHPQPVTVAFKIQPA